MKRRGGEEGGRGGARGEIRISGGGVEKMKRRAGRLKKEEKEAEENK